MRRCAHHYVCWAMVEYGETDCPGRCDAYAPAHDDTELLAVAREMRLSADATRGGDYFRLVTWADRIDRALGVTDHADA